MHNKFKIMVLVFIFSLGISAQKQNRVKIPAVYSNIKYDAVGKMYVDKDGLKIYEEDRSSPYRLKNLQGNPKGTAKGLSFNFNIPDFSGTLFYGFIPFGDSEYPLPVYFKSISTISKGKTNINLKKMRGKYDMIDWEAKGYGTLGYRVTNKSGKLMYDGIVSFGADGEGFKVLPSIIVGPTVNLPLPEGITISLTTNEPADVRVQVNNRDYYSRNKTKHEIKITGLRSDTAYDYKVTVGKITQQYHFKTAPTPGSRKPFTFAYASDSRQGKGGGERDLYGTNFYIIKKMMALSKLEEVSFMQFTGDLIGGYLSDKEQMNLQYANWKRAVEPFAHSLPVYVGMGNHEALSRYFVDKQTKTKIAIDRFPFETESAEAVFAENYVNPENGPVSEDGAKYDPDSKKIDFPPYKETVYYYTYGNVAMIVMNSNYYYAPYMSGLPLTGGGLHAYIMDEQFKWVEKTVEKLEKDKNIDHIFVTEHTPFFPNGGHVWDDMWYNGNNEPRTWVAGKALDKGIIERRDQLLDLFVNKSSKVIAILTGDEHNYVKTEIGPDTEIYPENYKPKKIKLSRTIWQINNGAAGAPYYSQEQTPWTDKTTGFTTQNALVLFHVNGQKIDVEVMNPDTLEKFSEYSIR